MTEISRPFTGSTGSGAPGDAGPYSASQWWDVWKYLTGAHDANTGVLIGSGTAPDIGLTVQEQSPAAAGVRLTPGRAIVQGTFYENDANLNLSITPNASGNSRIDTIVLRRDSTAQTIRAIVLVGTPAGSPVPPTLTQTAALYEIPLADVTVANGFVTILNASINPRKYFSNAADGTYLLDVQNRAGSDLQTGDVVVNNTSNDRSVDDTTTFGDPNVLGVWVGRTTSLGYGRVLNRGIGYVRMEGAATRGQLIYAATTVRCGGIAAIATSENPMANKVPFAIALETIGSAGLCLCYLDKPDVLTNTIPFILRDNAAAYTTTSASFVDVDATNLTINHVSKTGRVLVCFNAIVHHSVATNRIDIDIDVNGARIGASFADGLTGTAHPTAAIAGKQAVHIAIPYQVSTTSTNTFKPQWKTSAAAASMLSGAATPADHPIQFWVMDI